MTRAATHAMPRVLPALVFLSGASSLVYEVLWIRALGRHFGTTVPAISTVLACFMAGMAIGNLLFGRLADRSTRPYRMYRYVELGIAVWACGVSVLLLRGDAAVAALARAVEAAGEGAGLVRFVAFALLLVGPSTLIGGTLTVLARALVGSGHSGEAIGTLYAVNTAGAVAGALAPDLLLVPAIGLTATAFVAAAGNLVVVAGARVLDRGEMPARPEPRGGVPPGTGAALVLYAVSGFCAMAVEVLWSRTLSHWSAALAASYAVLLAVFLAALALGSYATRRFADRVANPLGWGAATVAATGIAVLVPVLLAGPWRDGQRALLPRDGAMRYGMGYEAFNAFTHAVFLELPACLLMGAGLPFLAAAVVRTAGAGQQTARLYAINTVAGVLGSLAAGFLWLPSLGEVTSYLVVAVLATTGAAAVAWRLAPSWPRRVALACVPVAAAAAVLVPPDHLYAAHFRGSGHVLDVREGTTTTAAVAQHFEFGVPAHRELLTPGVSMSDTSFTARRYMAMMGHLGAFFAERPERALLICYGVGNTAQALLAHPGLELDVVDIAREVLELSPAFQSPNPLANGRARLFVDDGRHHLLARDAAYDVITSEPPPPNHAGVVNLYSREYYRIARTRLRPGGVLTQWLPVFQLARDEVQAIVAAFVVEFPHAGLFYGQGLQWILVGSDRPLEIEDARWRARAADASVAESLARIGVDSVEDLYATWMLDDAELRAYVQGVEPLSDDRPSIQYPRDPVRGEVPLERPPRDPARVLAALKPPADVALRARIERAVAATDALYGRLARLDDPDALRIATFALPLAAEASFESGVEAVLDLLEADRGRTARALALLSAHPDPAALLRADPATMPAARQRERVAVERANRTLAARAYFLGTPAETIRRLGPVHPGPDGAVEHWLWLGAAQCAEDHHDEARAALSRARTLAPDVRLGRALDALFPDCR